MATAVTTQKVSQRNYLPAPAGLSNTSSEYSLRSSMLIKLMISGIVEYGGDLAHHQEDSRVRLKSGW